MSTDPERDHWLRRIDATGRAQARYLWLTLVAGLFYAALHFGGPDSQVIEVPIVDLQVDASSVHASGGVILAFLVLATMGAIRAWGQAVKRYRAESTEKASEQLDTYPNAIDLAVYTTPESPRVIRVVTSFVYPVFLSAALLEAAWLLVWVRGASSVPWRTGFLVAGTIAWIPAAWLVLKMWWSRFKRFGKQRRAG